MKTYYAVGNKTFRVPVINHEGAFGGCSFFKACPLVHVGEISEQGKIDNFNSCNAFKLFDSKEHAFDFASVEKYEKGIGGYNVFLIFKIQADENNLSKPVSLDGVRYIETDNSHISSLDESFVNTYDVFRNTKPSLLEETACRIF